jgi:hypothetical protein
MAGEQGANGRSLELWGVERAAREGLIRRGKFCRASEMYQARYRAYVAL